MRYFVVGGAGFIGSHLVDRLLAEEQVVDVVDDLSTGSLANLSAARSLGADLKIHHLGVGDDNFAALVAMREPDVIVHLAWMPPGADGTLGAASTLANLLSVLEAARRTGSTKVLLAIPAGALYGEVPARELPAKEGRPWASSSVDSILARTTVELVNLWRDRSEVEFTVLAMTNVYGPRQRPDGGVVAAFAAALRRGEGPIVHGDGRQARDLLFIDDAVDALVRSSTRGGGLVVNIGTGVLTSIRDLATMMAPAGVSAEFAPGRTGDLQRCSVAPTRARIQLSWAPWTDLSAGLSNVLRGHTGHE